MKKLCLNSLLAVLVFFLFACGSGQDATVPSTEPETSTRTGPETSFSYEQLRFVDFLLSSGAGAWGTTLHIREDGSFSGIYHDSEMGDNAPEYPHGTLYYCEFSGQLGTPIWLDDHTWRLPILTIQYTHTPDTQEIKDSIRYCYTTAFGLEGTRELLLYLPGVPMDRLPEEYRQWVRFMEVDQTGALPFHGIYNQEEQLGFSGSHRLESIRRRAQEAEAADAALQASLEEAATQMDMNALAQQRYEMWDELLNDLWAVLKQTMEKDAFAVLTREQLDWIQEKEQAASDAAGEYEGGSLAPLVWATTAADMTRNRVCYLMTCLPE